VRNDSLRPSRRRGGTANANELVAYETLDEGRIARICSTGPMPTTRRIAACWFSSTRRSPREADDTVRVVILAARGKNFSAGHDLGSEQALAEREPGPGQHPSFRSRGRHYEPIMEKFYHQEWHYFSKTLPLARSTQDHYRQVQGNAISAGLMLIWACDLIVAADNAKFSDVVAVRLGMPASNIMLTLGNSVRVRPKNCC